LELTQLDAAEKLGLTQAYLSMLERGTRRVSAEVAARAVQVFEIPAIALPLDVNDDSVRDAESFKRALGALGYPGFAYLKAQRRLNPARLLLEAIDAEDLDSRVTEALPWIPYTYPNLNWDWLILNAKVRDRQSRLGFIVELARQAAEKVKDVAVQRCLAKRVAELERSRLAAEDTLCKASITRAEKKWLKTHRSTSAKHWNLLSDLAVEHLEHVFG
jgi:transcriptional regulator with XRE-family HTH domain